MDSINLVTDESPYKLMLMAAIHIPLSHYLIALILILTAIMYKILEMHFVQDLLTGFRGQPVRLAFNPSSELYRLVVSKCTVLHGRYLSTPWLCSPHLQTMFLTYCGNAPDVPYRRQLFSTEDGGTVALDWVINYEGEQDDRNPIVMIIPGLASHANSSYVKHVAYKMAKSGRNAVVINHRGLGGVSLTSDWFYHGGWVGDIRAVVNHFNSEYPDAPIFLVGTSIGANLLVFYLGEDGKDVPIVGAAAICSPWDPLLCDRFLNRGFIQKVYSKAIATGLRVYANLHKAVISRITNWEGIEKTLYIRDFDNSAFRYLAKCETVDTYYRRGCSTNVLRNVMVPLLSISALDDPICTREAIPWDECRVNDNVVLASTEHGGHLPLFEGLKGKNLWWVRAVDEFFSVLQSSSLGNRIKKEHMPVTSANALEPSSTQVPHVNISYNDQTNQNEEEDMIHAKAIVQVQEKQNAKIDLNTLKDVARSPEQDPGADRKRLNMLSCWNQNSLWMLAFRTMGTTWPFAGLVFAFIFRKRLKKFFSSTSLTR